VSLLAVSISGPILATFLTNFSGVQYIVIMYTTVDYNLAAKESIAEGEYGRCFGEVKNPTLQHKKVLYILINTTPLLFRMLQLVEKYDLSKYSVWSGPYHLLLLRSREITIITVHK
jgi:hypothetical protein